MRILVEQSIIALFALYNTYNLNLEIDLAFYFIISLIISIGLNLLNSKKGKLILYLVFISMCFYNNIFIFYFPLILYNMYLDLKLYSFISSPLILINLSSMNLLLSIISAYLAITTVNLKNTLDKSKLVRDNLKEDTIYLKKYNNQLKIDREKNIHIAILTERNRIAREIHDSIGHTISSSILQVKALRVISKEDILQKNLDILQNTLNNGMEDIRKSLHNLHNESFDLERKIESFSKEFPSLNIKISYNLEDNLSYDLKFDILSVVKEAITNCVKHSNATELSINLLSQPKFHTVIVKDNGNTLNTINSHRNKGIGLNSMGEIATKYNGFFNYNLENGFKIHLTLMKG